MTDPKVLDTVVQATALVLQRDDVTAESNFLELGGSSLAAIHLVDKLNKQLGVELSPLAPFEAENLRALADLCLSAQAG
ncbi:MAG: acyl carrier protein [Actinomadura rubrobrunea]|nr:acyl carrier protein [Actinomadura rubrobrunea]